MSTNFDPTQHEIDQALKSLGLGGKKASSGSPSSDNAEILPPTPKEVFTDAGAGLEEAAITVASLMASSNTPALQLKAAEMALRVHGIFKDAEDKGNKAPQINIQINASDGSHTLLNVVMPAP